jgi:hypothetical protein
MYCELEFGLEMSFERRAFILQPCHGSKQIIAGDVMVFG